MIRILVGIFRQRFITRNHANKRIRLRLYSAAVVALIAFSAFSTVIVFSQQNPQSAGIPINQTSTLPFPISLVVRAYLVHAYEFSLGGWISVIGAVYWRGRVKSNWKNMGFNRDIFKLFLQMKGGETRIEMLKALSVPKDRQQLAKELGYDWNVADRQIRIFIDYGLVRESQAYGDVKIYQLTATGRDFLQLVQQYGEVRSSDKAGSNSVRPAASA